MCVSSIISIPYYSTLSRTIPSCSKSSLWSASRPGGRGAGGERRGRWFNDNPEESPDTLQFLYHLTLTQKRKKLMKKQINYFRLVHKLYTKIFMYKT